MDSLQAAVMVSMIFVGNNVSISILSHPRPLVCLCQGDDAFICNVGTLDQTNPLQLGERGQSSDRLIRKMGAAAQINIANPVT